MEDKKIKLCILYMAFTIYTTHMCCNKILNMIIYIRDKNEEYMEGVMAKKMKTFQDTKKIGVITIHYDKYFDEAFVDDIVKYTENVAKSQKTNLDKPKQLESMHIYIYANVKDFFAVFGETIEKRYYKGKRSAEDMYIVQDGAGNLHIASPSGKDKSKRNVVAQIVVVKVISEFIEPKEVLKLKEIVKAGFKKEEMLRRQEKEQIELKEQNAREIEEYEFQEQEIREQEEQEKQEKQEYIQMETEQLEELSIRHQEEMSEQEELSEPIEDLADVEAVLEDTKDKGVDVPEWMIVGWRAYATGRLTKKQDLEDFSEHLSKKKYKSLSKLNFEQTKVFKPYDFSRELALARIQYIIKVYSLKKLAMVFRAPEEENMLKTLHSTKGKFDREVKAFTYKNYRNVGERKAEMDLDIPKSIVQITFDSEGVDMVESIDGETHKKQTNEKII